MATAKGQPVHPVVRVAPLGELNVYPVYEHELETLGRGSPASVFLNFALALLPTAAGIAVTLRSSTTSDLNLVVLTCVGVIFALAGLLCLLLWWRMHVNVQSLMKEIKNRMPPQLGTPEPTSTKSTSRKPPESGPTAPS